MLTKIRITIYKYFNKILFKLRLKSKGKHIFINIYTGKITTIDELIFRTLFKMVNAQNIDDFWYGSWYFYRILETLPSYFDDDFFTDDDSDNIAWYDSVNRDWSDSSKGGGASLDLLDMTKEYKIIKTATEENEFMLRMKEWFPWQFGIHNWKTFENHK